MDDMRGSNNFFSFFLSRYLRIEFLFKDRLKIFHENHQKKIDPTHLLDLENFSGEPKRR